mmetsp:Transcript_21631/g.17972  ORF Transcript_21631/g.17972 Transcript_21631/m.17972 type:complete len:80 (-) Transcript_21631:46-285(-)
MGEGMQGRVLDSGTYEWCSNVQKLTAEEFSRSDIALNLGIKTVFNVAVCGGFVELSSTEEKVEDKLIVDAVIAMFQLIY